MVAAGVVLALVLAGGGCVAGRTLAENDAKASASATTGRQGARGQGQGQTSGPGAGGANGARALNGQVLSVGDGTLTIQLSGQDPAAQGSRIVLVAPSTRVVKTAETDVKLSDLKAGERVTVVGQENADGHRQRDRGRRRRERLAEPVRRPRRRPSEPDAKPDPLAF